MRNNSWLRALRLDTFVCDGSEQDIGWEMNCSGLLEIWDPQGPRFIHKDQ